jgi:diguanylate cyclase (GGDEF)-like protein
MFVIRKLLTLFLISLALLVGHANALELTPEEKVWLKTHTVIRYAPSPNYPPIEFVDQNKRHRGLTSDLIDLLQSKIELPLKIKRYSTWEAVMDATRSGQVDLLGSIAKIPPRENYLSFTNAYISLPAKILMRRDSEDDQLNITQLLGKRVVVVKGYASSHFLQENYPSIATIEVPSIEIGVRMVAYDMADAIITTEAAAAYYLEKHNLSSLKVVGDTELVWSLRFASRKDWPELTGIIQKALNDISEDEKQALYQRWMKLEYSPYLISGKLLNLLLFCAVGIIILVLLFWGLFQRKEKQQYRISVESIKLRNLELEQQLANLQTIDPVTGITTRKAWLDEAAKELARYHRYGNSFAIIVVELDGYKLLHNAQGSRGSEELMSYIISIIKAELREYDLCADLGNGELGLLVQGVDKLIAERVSLRIIRKVIEADGMLINGKHYRSLIRCGISVPRAVSTSADELLEHAESKLKAAASSSI